MNFIEKVIHGLQKTMNVPTPFGWFHLLFIAIMIGLSVLLCLKFKDAKDKTFRTIVFIFWVIMAVLEIYKQVVFSYHYSNGSWDYPWYIFPFQFCSTPLYVLPMIFILKDSKVRDACIGYLATYSLFAGISVFIYPNGVFIDWIGINIQTMIHHGFQIVLGIYFIAYQRKKYNFKYFLHSSIVFLLMLMIAMLLNETLSPVVNGVFNLFFINKRYTCELPILVTIQANAPYIVFLLSYILGFIVVAFIVFITSYGIIKITDKKKPVLN